MTTRFTHPTILLTLTAVISGCSLDTGEPTTASQYQSLACGTESYEVDGEVFTRNILYSPDEITALVAKYHLSSNLGFERVNTCDQAAKAVEAIQEATMNLFPGDTGVDQATYPQEAESSEKIRYAAGTGPETGTVEVLLPGASCSGTLVGYGAVLTSAHCLDAVLDPADPSDGIAGANIQVNYHDPSDNSWYCISAPSTTVGKCTSSRYSYLVMHGPYVGDGNTDSDIGIVLLPGSATFSRINSGDLLRVYTDTFNAFPNYEIHGRGDSSDFYQSPDPRSGGGTVRWGSFGNDVYGTYAYYSVARTPRICRGDSGGPAVVVNSGYAQVIGLTSKFSHPSNESPNCTPSGYNQYGTRLNQKINWVEDWLQSIKGVSCTAFTGSLGNYRRCW